MHAADSSHRSIVTANAGSGKTYLLANRLIRWMIEAARRNAGGNCDAESILAITFTRKAAGEILDRVLRHLALGATSAASREQFETPGMIGRATEAEYAAVLAQVLDHLDRLSIGTIDGFFSRLGKAFAAELGLPAEWTIASDDQDHAQRALALSRLLEAKPKVVWELVRMVTDGAPKARLHDALLTSIRTPLALLELADRHGVGDAPWHALTADHVQFFEGAQLLTAADLDAALRDLAAAPVATTKTGTPDSRWVKGRNTLLAAATRGDWRDVPELGFAAKIASGGAYYNVDPDQELVRCVRRIMHHALAIETKLIKQRIAGCVELARGFNEHAAAIRHAEGRYSFAEIGAAIARAHRLQDAGSDGLQEMRYRLDCAIQDLAIDECQDTSPDQYSVLAPFMDEIFASDSERRFIMVGDPKQSIYGWRGGTPALIGRIRTQRSGGLDADVQLAVSQRSHPAVMDLVNSVFGPSDTLTLADRLQSIDRAAIDPAAHHAALLAAGIPAPSAVASFPIDRVVADWTFVPHQSAARLQGKPASISASCTLPEETWSAAAARVALAASQQRPGATIAILVNTNQQIGDVVQALRQLGVGASDEGRGSLMDSMVVAVLMALLRVAEQPLDQTALLMVTQAPVRTALDGIVPIPEYASAFACERLGASIRQALHERGLTAWLDDVAQALTPLSSARDRVRVRQVLALAATAPADVASRPERFVRLVHSTGSRTVSGDRIRVMTVHASKGLEFDEVILPALNDPLDEVKATNGAWASINDGPGGAPLAIGPVVRKDLAGRSPLLAAINTEARVIELFDGLSAFYVALTRAKSGVHFICTEPTKVDEPKLTPLWLLRVSIEEFGGAYKRAFAIGGDRTKPFWGNGISSADVAAALNELAPPRANATTRALPTVTVAEAVTASGPVRVALPEAGSDPIAMRRGTIVHALLRQVTWAAPSAADLGRGGGLDDQAIARAHALVQAELRSPVPTAELAAAVELARAALAGPVGAALTKPDGPVEWSVHGELPFQCARPGREGGRMGGRMDRVVLGTDGSRITHAQVIDFKTGSVGMSEQQVLDHYRDQMNDYRVAAAELTGLAPATIAVSLLMIDRGDVIAA
ncbi:MAG: UvrD-helicase domain-containing protein [Planctomycetes bacterium]|nr:UvrD-helicase domain-containing protein [Planctomycetota bacterium]